MKTFIRYLDSFNHAATTIARYIVCTCVAFMILIVFCGVVWRYLLLDALSWVDELAALMLVVISFLGCYLALHKHKVARIDLFISMLKGRAKKVAYVVSECASLLMIFIVIYYGAQLFLMPTSLRQKTPGMYIPLWIFYGMIPFTFLLNAFVSVANILHYIYDQPGELESSPGIGEGVSL